MGAVAFPSQIPESVPVGANGVDVRGLVGMGVAPERDPAPVSRPRWIDLDGALRCKRAPAAAIGVDDVELQFVRVGDQTTVRRPSRATIVPCAARQIALAR